MHISIALDRDRAGAQEGDTRMRSVEAWKRKQMRDPAFKAAYDALEDEFADFAIGTELLKARTRAKLTQAQVAKRMGTSQSAVARMESGRAPSMASLRKYAKATGSKIEIKLKAG
jgi:DNA-binding transcriptional regulator YiaG